MGKIVIHDTADVTITDLNTGKVVLNAEAQLAQITGAISEEDLKGGIGNRKLYKIRTDKEVNLTMRSAVADVEYWAMTQGVAVDEAGTALVTESIKSKTQDDGTGNVEVLIPTGVALKLGDKVSVNLPDGVQVTAEVLEDTSVTPATLYLGSLIINDGKKTPYATPLVDGQDVTIFYQREVTGKQIKIDSNKFSGKYRVEMHTIAYDLETATITSDIYFDFPETIPAGEFDISLENGSVYTPEISFSVMNPIGSSVLGTITEEARP